jgi:hypothetical protein
MAELAEVGSLLPDGVTVKTYEPAGSARNEHVCVPVGGVDEFDITHEVTPVADTV